MSTTAPSPSLAAVVEYCAKSLVTKPNEVRVEVSEKEDALIVELHVAPDDIGKMIGKSGQTARSIRKVLSAATTKNDKKAVLRIAGEGGEAHEVHHD